MIDYSKNELADRAAIERCPTDAIVWVEGPQFVEMRQPAGSEVA